MHRNGGSPFTGRGVIETRKAVIELCSPGYLLARFDADRHCRAVSYATGIRKIMEFSLGPFDLDATMINASNERMNNG
jgi:hypothetical protein